MQENIDVRDKIEQGFVKVLTNTTFNKCKVTEIIKAAEVSHQTFYRYYVDKYDLADKYIARLLSLYPLIYGENARWKDIVITVLYSIQNNSVLFKRMLEDPEGCEMILKDIVNRSVDCKVSPQWIAGWIQIFKKWSLNNFKDSIDDVYYAIRKNVSIADVMSPEEIDRIMSVYEERPLNFFREKSQKS